MRTTCGVVRPGRPRFPRLPRFACKRAHADTLGLRPGSNVLTAGHPHELVVVLEGEASIVHPDGTRTRLGPGTELGARELLAREATPHTVVASTTLDLLVVNGPAVRWAYAEGLCRLVPAGRRHDPRGPRAPRAGTPAGSGPACDPRPGGHDGDAPGILHLDHSLTEGSTCASATRPPAPGR